VDFSTFGAAVWVDLDYAGIEAWTRDGPNVTMPTGMVRRLRFSSPRSAQD
jgi:hypothetical protein